MPQAVKPRPKARSKGEGKSLSDYLDQIRGNPAEFRTVSRQVNPMNFDVTAVLKHLDNRGEYPTVQFDNPLNLHGEPSEFPIVAVSPTITRKAFGNFSYSRVPAPYPVCSAFINGIGP